MNHLPHIFQMIDVQILMLEVQLLANLITHLLSLSKEKQGQHSLTINFRLWRKVLKGEKITFLWLFFFILKDIKILLLDMSDCPT